MFAGLKAQVNIGGTLGFTAAKTSGYTTMTLSSNSTTSTSGTGSFGASGNGITVSAGVSRTAWTKDGTTNSYDVQNLTFTNGGTSSANSNDIGTFSLTFTPTGGTTQTLATWNYTLDSSTSANKYFWNMVSPSYTGTYNNMFGSNSNDFTELKMSSFTYNSSVYFYSVYGNTFGSTGTTIAEGNNNTSIIIGFQLTNIQPIPEPGTYALAGPLVLFGAMGVRKWRRKSRPAAPTA